MRRVAGKVLGFDGIQLRKKDYTVPGEVEAEVVVGDVDGADVPVFVEEEVEDVDCLEKVDDCLGGAEGAVGLVLVGGPGAVAGGVLLGRNGRLGEGLTLVSTR